MSELTKEVQACIKQVEACQFECEGGPLRLNRGWTYLQLNLYQMQEQIDDITKQLAEAKVLLDCIDHSGTLFIRHMDYDEWAERLKALK